MLTAAHFDDLCGTGPVQSQIDTIETSRKAALRKFWMYLGGGLVLAFVVSSAIVTAGYDVWGWAAFIIVTVFAFIFAMRPLGEAAKALKHPTLEALAAQGGMDYLPEGFEPPVYVEAQKVLFGGRLSAQRFSDLFYGRDEDGTNFALYEATLEQGHGKQRHQVFSGQVYAFQRKSPRQGTTVITPDKGMFNFFKPAKGMERVKFESHPEFEKRFEVYSTHPMEATTLLSSSLVRDKMLELRGTKWGHKVLVYVGPTDALVAITGKDRFEPGSMFKSRGGQERVRAMFDEVCESLGTLKSLRQIFG